MAGLWFRETGAYDDVSMGVPSCMKMSRISVEECFKFCEGPARTAAEERDRCLLHARDAFGSDGCAKLASWSGARPGVNDADHSQKQGTF